MTIDALDVEILGRLRLKPRISILELARELGVARNTVYSRIQRLVDGGVVSGFGPDIDLSRLGFPVTAFTTVSVVQGRFSEVIAALEQIPEVLEAYTVAGLGDLFCRVAARSNDELMVILERILALDGVDRTTTAIALAHSIPYRTHPLVESLVGGRD